MSFVSIWSKFALTLYLAHVALVLPRLAHAQEDMAEPPPAIEPGTDFEEMDEEMNDPGDEGNGQGFRPPPPPPISGPGNNQNPPTEFRGGGDSAGRAGWGGVPAPHYESNRPGAFSNSNGKVRFQIVEGDYWEKGKKRERGKKPSSNSRGSY